MSELTFTELATMSQEARGRKYIDSRLNINESFLHSSPRYVPKVEEQELR